MAQFNVDYFKEIDSEQKAYILGFLQSDGSFSCKGRINGYYRYKIAIQSADIHILNSMQAEMEHRGKLIIQKRKLAHHQDLAELSLNGIEFTEQLRLIFGGYLKDDRLNFPLLPPELVRHYIRGVTDADGSFGDYEGVLLRIDGKKMFLESVKNITGFRTSLNKGNGGSTYTLRATGDEAINFIEWMYGDLSRESLYLSRKYATAKKLCEGKGVQLQEVA